ncbi:MAG: hypothetical protein HOO96_08025 [Polyangiaceae bacterium]|nr:hypothetical protein [Polyangiaceae bacterium]
MTLRGLAFCALALACGCETFDSPVTDGGVDASGRLDGGDAFDAPATPDGDSVKIQATPAWAAPTAPERVSWTCAGRRA